MKVRETERDSKRERDRGKKREEKRKGEREREREKERERRSKRERGDTHSSTCGCGGIEGRGESPVANWERSSSRQQNC